MTPEPIPPVSIASGDIVRLKRIAEQAVNNRHPIGSFLLSEIERASVYEPAAVPLDCVRLDEWVAFRADNEEPLQSRILVTPENFRNNSYHVSVLSPLGAALVGLRVGASMRYIGSDGTSHTATVVGLDPPDGVVSLMQRRSRGSAPPPDNEPPEFPGPTAA